MEFIELLITLANAALQYGPLGFGWVLAVALIIFFFVTVKAKDKELASVKQQQAKDVKFWNDKLEKLHDKQSNMVTDLTEKRVEDLKELVEDYNDLATSVVTSLDKLSSGISNKRSPNK